MALKEDMSQLRHFFMWSNKIENQHNSFATVILTEMCDSYLMHSLLQEIRCTSEQLQNYLSLSLATEQRILLANQRQSAVD